MMMKNEDLVIDGFSTLFDLFVLKFKIDFTAEKTWRLAGTGGPLRGRIGFGLKKRICPYDDFRKRSCEECALVGECLYIKLFAPRPRGPMITRQGRLKPGRTPVRPFIFTLDGGGDGAVLEEGEAGVATFTLFGPAIEYLSVFLEITGSALQSLPFTINGMDLVSPGSAGPGDAITETSRGRERRVAWPLWEWVKGPDPGAEKQGENVGNGAPGPLRLELVTPVRLKEKGRSVYKDLTFPILIKALLRRLRDLKRAFGNDNDMGAGGKRFFQMVEAVQVEKSRLFWRKKKRYSHGQKQDVFLNGLEGEIAFRGPTRAFTPLLRAGEIVHIGKGTSSGNGRICLAA
ncbi:MAG: CRISPR system precrRNA processing endoribonuclease RAMP protein Cas6 [Desulfobacterales bacterium]|nr:CRISPR system precrRNA processing endoribonuclease RAMP protein Cas6 [Desulfobacterales bacterium]